MVPSHNATAVAYINHKRGPKSHAAQEEADLILSWEKLPVPPSSAVHIYVVEEWQVDFFSY